MISLYPAINRKAVPPSAPSELICAFPAPRFALLNLGNHLNTAALAKAHDRDNASQHTHPNGDDGDVANANGTELSIVPPRPINVNNPGRPTLSHTCVCWCMQAITQFYVEVYTVVFKVWKYPQGRSVDVDMAVSLSYPQTYMT